MVFLFPLTRHIFSSDVAYVSFWGSFWSLKVSLESFVNCNRAQRKHKQITEYSGIPIFDFPRGNKIDSRNRASERREIAFGLSF